MKALSNYLFKIALCSLFLIGCFSLSAQSDLPAENVHYNLKIIRGAGAGMLSCAGAKVDLWYKDDNSGRQKWRFKEVSPGIYNIFVFYTESNRQMLSCGQEGYVDLWHTDDGSGRQRWKVIPLGNGTYNIMVAGGVGGRKYLSTNGEGKVDLWYKDDNSGRQQWFLQPEDIELKDVKFDLPNMVEHAQPDFVTTVSNRNGTDNNSEMIFTFQRKATETSSFQREHGFTFTMGVEKKVKMPLVGSAKINTSISTTNTWTYGSSESQTDTREYSVKYNVPPHKKVTMYATVKMYKVNVPYTAIGISKVSGKEVVCKGIWEGVMAGKIDYSSVQEDI